MLEINKEPVDVLLDALKKIEKSGVPQLNEETYELVKIVVKQAKLLFTTEDANYDWQAQLRLADYGFSVTYSIDNDLSMRINYITTSKGSIIYNRSKYIPPKPDIYGSSIDDITILERGAICW